MEEGGCIKPYVFYFLFFIFYFLYFDIFKKESINSDLMRKINNNFEIDALIVKRSENKLIFF